VGWYSPFLQHIRAADRVSRAQGAHMGGAAPDFTHWVGCAPAISASTLASSPLPCSRTRQPLPFRSALTCAQPPPWIRTPGSSGAAPHPYSVQYRHHREQQHHLELLRDSEWVNSHIDPDREDCILFPRLGPLPNRSSCTALWVQSSSEGHLKTGFCHSTALYRGRSSTCLLVPEHSLRPEHSNAIAYGAVPPGTWYYSYQ
jgi:hypothetical protein